MLTRRKFIAGSAIYCTAQLLGVNRSLGAQPKRPKIATLTTIYHKYSHAQHIVDRFLEGYGWEGRHHRPEMDLVSLYVEQVGENDLSRERARRHSQLKIYPTIADALTLGGDSLAVDGVLLIGEHGSYPSNDRGQTLYPRYEYFKQVVDVYRQSGRTAPVFNDKHLSCDPNLAARLGSGQVFSLLFYLPYRSLRNFFSPQVHHIETLFATGKSPYPIERTLLTTGLTAAGVESLYLAGKKLSTPHLAIEYQPVPESLYWRS